MSTPTDNATEAFIAKWTGTTAPELSTPHSFLIDLCVLLSAKRGAGAHNLRQEHRHAHL
ncbi:MAG: hypothetical protein K0M64_01875 [Rhizobium sp.]|nr:hypothetical protein [Rhizobium sp.]